MNYKSLNIKWLGHSGFLIKGEKIIYIDPFKIGDFEEKADIILITHSHYDHCSVEDIKKILKPETRIIGPADMLSLARQLGERINFQIIFPGKSMDIDSVKINAIPAYNINKPFHSRDENWMGYLIVLDEIVLYHSGDTDLIPEMNGIEADVVFLPVSGKFTMNFEDAAKAAEIIKPDLAIPMHYNSIVGNLADAEMFAEECKKKGIKARVLEKGI